MLNKAHENGTVPERSASLIIMLTDGQPDGCKYLNWGMTLTLC